MKVYLLLFTFVITFTLHAQEQDIPFIGYFGGYGFQKTIKTDSTGTLFIPNIDTNVIIFLAKNLTIYKMYDRKNRLISEGSVGGRKYVDYFKKFGKWTVYYPETGKEKLEGYFYADDPVGTWQYYFLNGQLKQRFSVARVVFDTLYFSCRVGLYEEYFDNGQVKTRGFYKVAIDTFRQSTYDITLNRFNDALMKGPVGKPDGLWLFYKINGELEQSKEYK